MNPSAHYVPGDAVNGHRLSADGTSWEPITPISTPPLKNRLGKGTKVGIAVVGGFLLAVGSINVVGALSSSSGLTAETAGKTLDTSSASSNREADCELRRGVGDASHSGAAWISATSGSGREEVTLVIQSQGSDARWLSKDVVLDYGSSVPLVIPLPYDWVLESSDTCFVERGGQTSDSRAAATSATSSSAAAAPAQDPQASATPAVPADARYPLLVDSTLTIRSGPYLDAEAIGQLAASDTVVIECTATGDPVEDGDGISNSRWNRIIAPAQGWISAAFVDAGTTPAAQQACGDVPTREASAPPTYESGGSSGGPSAGSFYGRPALIDALQGRVLADAVLADGHANVAILALQDPYGETLAAQATKAIEDGGGTVVYTEFYDPKATDFSAIIDQASSTSPDAVILIAFDETKTIIPQAASRNFGPQDVPYFLVDGNLANYSEDFDPGTMTGTKGTLPGGVEYDDNGDPTSASIGIYEYGDDNTYSLLESVTGTRG